MITNNTNNLQNTDEVIVRTEFEDKIKYPILIGHRGMGEEGLSLKTPYVENTIKSFNDAFKAGASWIEFDVQLTKDKIPVIYHDYKKKGKLICDMSEKEFCEKKKNLCKSTRSKFTLNYFITEQEDTNGYRRCTLQQMFLMCPHIGFNIEIKYPSSKECAENQICSFLEVDEYVKPILDVVKLHNKEKLYFSSFSLEVCKYLNQNQRKHPVFYLEESDLEKALEIACDNNFAGIVVNSKCITAKDISTVHNRNKIVIIYGDTANKHDSVLDLLQNGIDGIITDNIVHVKDAFERFKDLQYQNRIDEEG